MVSYSYAVWDYSILYLGLIHCHGIDEIPVPLAKGQALAAAIVRALCFGCSNNNGCIEYVDLYNDVSRGVT